MCAWGMWLCSGGVFVAALVSARACALKQASKQRACAPQPLCTHMLGVFHELRLSALFLWLAFHAFPGSMPLLLQRRRSSRVRRLQHNVLHEPDRDVFYVPVNQDSLRSWGQPAQTFRVANVRGECVITTCAGVAANRVQRLGVGRC